MDHDYMEKKVDEVLSPYELLDVSAIQDRHQIEMQTAMPWRMNLCAVSQQRPGLFFIALYCHVFVYRLGTVSGPFNHMVTRLTSPSMSQSDNGPDSAFVINAIKVGRMLDKEIIVTVAENGEICIWKTDALGEQPLTLRNDASTWGIAIHGNHGLLAVSANNWKITVFNILKITQQSGMFYDENSNKQRLASNMLKEDTQIDLEGHTNNIPNIDFSASGRHIASCSIDQTCRIWDLGRKETVRQFKTGSSRDRDSDGWGWSVKFIKFGEFKLTQCKDQQINQMVMRRIEQKRPFTLSSIGLSHSAILPIYRINNSFLENDDGSDFEFAEIFRDYYPGEWNPELLQGEMENGLPNDPDHEDDTSVSEVLEDNDSDRWSNNSQSLMEYTAQQDHNSYMEESATEPQLRSELDQSSEEGGLLDEIERRYIEEIALGDEIDGETEVEDAVEAAYMEAVLRSEDDGLLRDYGYHPDDASSFGPNNWPRPRLPGIRDGLGDSNINLLQNIQAIFGQYGRTLNWAPPTAPQLVAGGWDADNVPSAPAAVKDEDTEEEEEEEDEEGEEDPQRIPHVITSKDVIIRKSQEQTKMEEYLLLATKTDLYLLNTRKKRMALVRKMRNTVSDVDVRSDNTLSMMDRLNMVEWIPEFELLIVASQKGTVALTRVLQVKIESGLQTCLFNNEYYLPLNGLQTTGLYGMTVRKAETDRMAGSIYHLYLFYYEGNVLAYRISRSRSSELQIDTLNV